MKKQKKEERNQKQEFDFQNFSMQVGSADGCSFAIEFPRDVVFMSSAPVCGAAVLTVCDAPVFLEENIELRVVGEAIAAFEMREWQSKSYSWIPYRRGEVVAEQRVVLFATARDAMATQLMRGTHRFPFTFTLPSTVLPTCSIRAPAEEKEFSLTRGKR